MKDLEQEQIEDLERKLRFALRHRAAPVGLKQRVLATARERRRTQHGRGWMVQRIAASAVLAAVFGGFAVYRQAEERRKGEEAREQVLTALRITSKTLNQVEDRVNDRINDR
jgi:hypothetical protein